MVNRKVKLKNLDGDYLYPYTDNIPVASTSVAGKVLLDGTPKSNSGNAVTSGAVFTALDNKLDKTATAPKATADGNGNNIVNTYALKNVAIKNLSASGTIGLTDNTVHRIKPTGTITFTLPAVSNHNVFHQMLVQANFASKIQVNLGTNAYFGGEAPQFDVGNYDIIYEHNGTKWMVGAVLVKEA